MSSSFLEISKIRKVFNPGEEIEVIGLHDITLDIDKGAFVVISGPSGSGKTTLLNIIGGLDNATSGSVTLAGHNITGLSEKKLSGLRRDHIGFVFQAYNLIPTLTVAENLLLPLELINPIRDHDRDKVTELLTQLDLANRLDSYPDRLSGGEQQRVAIARALVHNPDIILADEPTGNLDTNSTWVVVDLVEKINKWGTTILFGTHSEFVVNKLKKRVIHIEKGKIISDKKESSYE